MSSFFLISILLSLFNTGIGRLILLAAVLWYLDDRYLGWLSTLWAPVRRSQRIGYLRHTVENSPTDVGAMVELGDHYLHAGRPKAAVEYLERAMSRGEDSARALYLLGGAHVKLGRPEEGRKLLEAALAKKPDVAYGEPYIYLLEEAFATGSPDSERIDSLVADLSRFDGVEILTRAGQACAGAGRKDLAAELLNEAVHNYGFIPKKLRRRERRWMVRARLALLGVK